MIDIGIVILNYNGGKDTVECLLSLSRIYYTNYYVIVLDNGSSNFGNQYIIDNYPFSTDNNFEEYKRYNVGDLSNANNIELSRNSIVFVDNTQNDGFAKGNNICTDFFLRKGIKNILLLNNDTEVTPTFLSILVEYMENHTDVYALTPMICYHSDKSLIWNCGGKITFSKFRKYFFADQKVSKTTGIYDMPISFVTGCALLYKPEETGLLSEDFFFGEEDFEFSLRLSNRKQKMACVYDSLIYHKVSRSVPLKKRKGYIIVYYVNRFIDIKRYYPIYWRFYRFINILYALLFLLPSVTDSFKESMRMAKMIYRYSNVNNKVSYELFLEMSKFE